MKNEIYLSIVAFFFGILFINAQSSHYYYYSGQKVYLELDKAVVNLVTNNNFNTTETSNIGLKSCTLEQDNIMTVNKYGKVEFLIEPSLIEFYQNVNLLKSEPNLKSIGLFFTRNGGLCF